MATPKPDSHEILLLTSLLVSCECGEEYWLDEIDTGGQADHLLSIEEAQDLLLDAHSLHAANPDGDLL